MSRATSGPGPAIVLCFGVPAEEFAEVARAFSGRATLVTAPEEMDGRAALLAAAGLPPPDTAAAEASPPTRTPRRPVRVGLLTVDVDRRVVTWDEQPIDLSACSFDLLVALAGDAGRTWTFAELTAEVWDRTYLGDSDAVVSAVKRLRRQLCRTARSVVIESVRGVGFRLHTREPAPDPAQLPRPRIVVEG
jgi:two-component system, OmpR family, response regulator MtrA